MFYPCKVSHVDYGDLVEQAFAEAVINTEEILYVRLTEWSCRVTFRNTSDSVYLTTEDGKRLISGLRNPHLQMALSSEAAQP